jgi:hypothetical protein
MAMCMRSHHAASMDWAAQPACLPQILAMLLRRLPAAPLLEPLVAACSRANGKISSIGSRWRPGAPALQKPPTFARHRAHLPQCLYKLLSEGYRWRARPYVYGTGKRFYHTTTSNDKPMQRLSDVTYTCSTLRASLVGSRHDGPTARYEKCACERGATSPAHALLQATF